jgi:hypothetical protein
MLGAIEIILGDALNLITVWTCVHPVSGLLTEISAYSNLKHSQNDLFQIIPIFGG